MAGFEDYGPLLDGSPASTSAPASRASMRVDPEIQRGRDREAARLIAGEQNGYAGFIPTSAVVSGSRPAATPRVATTNAFDAYLEPSTDPAPAAKPPRDPMLPSFGEPLRGPEGGRISAGLLQRNTSEDWEPTPARAQTLAETPGGAVTGITRSGRRPAPSRSVGPVELAGTVIGSAAQVSDMFTTIGKQVLGAAPYWGARAGARWSGATDKEAAEAGQAAKDKFFPPEISTPWARVAEHLGGAAERAYYNNPVSFIFHGVGTAIEKGAEAAATENGMQKEDYLALADQLMGSLMWRGVRPKVQEAFRRRVDEARRGRPSGEPPFIDPPKALPGPDTGQGGAVERGAVIEGEFSRIPEPQRQAAISSASAWAKENALPAATASALAAWTVLGDRPEEGLIGLGLLGAMKGKGGMWHPKAVETLSNPIANAMNRGVQERLLPGGADYGNLAALPSLVNQVEPTNAWAKKASQTYLNRHMGTEGDPLAGYIEVPKLQAERKAVLTSIKNHEALPPVRYALRPATADRPADTPEKAQAIYERKLQERAVREEEVNEMRERAKQIEVALTKQKDGVAYDAASDIEIPFGEGVKKWGEITDQLVKSHPISNAPTGWAVDIPIEQQTKLMREKPNEPVWDVKTADDFVGSRVEPRAAAQALKSYLSHVGDFLRQNVAPEKLGQYDLVRAVRETAANDARIAKAMEREAADATKDLPVYKDYGDGFRWVELKLPEKLTEGQARGVVDAAALPKEGWTTLTRGGNREFGQYVPINSDGTLIQNTYTGQPATGRTPEEAYLAGQLAREGNQMGHCVGGYCEGVASGESRIFSLRDAKGKSHVTVEVEPSQKGLLDKNDNVMGDADNIIQIKGKQNRAPVAEYQKYVQDFVKEGKWGEVGDLDNTGLVDLTREARVSRDPRYAAEHDQFIQDEFGSERFVTEEELARRWANWKGGGRERGGVDPKLLIPLGLGAAVGAFIAEDKLLGAALGAAAAFALSRNPAALKAPLKTLDDIGGALSTRIGNDSPAIKLRLRSMEMNRFTDTAAVLSEAVPFMKGMGKMSGADAVALNRALMLNDSVAVGAELAKNPALRADFKRAWTALRDLDNQLMGVGRFKDMKGDFFPSVVGDVPGLLAALPRADAVRIEGILSRANEQSLKRNRRRMTDVEESALINQQIRANPRLADAALPFYHTPADGLFRYLVSAVADLEKIKFFGKAGINSLPGYLNLDASVAELTKREIAAGKLTPEGAERIEELLIARFGKGESAPKQWLQGMRDYTYATLLAHPSSSVIQLGDVGNSFVTQGFGPTLRAVGRKLTGRSEIGRKDFGLVDHIAEELVGTQPLVTSLKRGATSVAVGAVAGGLAFGPVGAFTGASIGLARAVGAARFVSRTFKLVGFTAVDGFAKDVIFNAALINLRNQASTPKGLKTLEEKYGEAYGGDFPDLVADLQAGKGRDSYPVRAAVFSELSDIQPVSKSEMSKAWLENPDARLLWMLKTYTEKQFDIARSYGYSEIKKGNVAKGLGRLARMAAILGVAGTSVAALQGWIRGRDDHIGWDDISDNVLKTLGWSQYVSGVAQREGPAAAVAKAIAPPYKIIDDLAMDRPQAAANIPVIGKIYYDHFAGGSAKWELAAQRRDKAAGREPRELSSEAEALRDADRDRRRERTLERLERR